MIDTADVDAIQSISVQSEDDEEDEADEESDTSSETGANANAGADADADVRNPQPPIEDEYVEEAPERGDEYFEAIAADRRWISYTNPRDRYRSPYLGEGSGKICVTLLNEEGETIVGETVPDTTVTVPTSDSIDWHSYAGPMTVDLPLTEHYDRPLDSDQFGTSDLPQGDGYMDSHCIEIHGMPEDGGYVGYDEPQIDGEHADWIEVVGYIQIQDTWDTDIDPIKAAESYEEAGGGWTYAEGDSHGQVVIVLQLDPPEDAYPDVEETESETGDSTETETETETDDGSDEETETETEAETETETETETATENADDDDGDVDEDESASASQMPGFGVLVAVAALVVAVLARARR
ncbi:PGF-CTERM sorting domain-containing protein [Halobacteria archaeon AArc-m2/3/4]|uniref:PGF-CTERM sorting domain-containing protein n=1 Tax=Natronoglomus mannanivorans TaxID=2979990 RepID=A0ABT2QE28_9EURY|nr:PGF-CTERM sorting domain-containing protein [Halobacteria archaeon AArc-m2/3/4]